MPRKGRPSPPTAPTGMPYGDRKELIEAQRAMPMAGPPSAPAPGAGAVAPPSAPVPAPDPMADARAMAMPPPAPLTAPSARPFEPVTAGLVNGPGPGPNLRRDLESRAARVALIWQRVADATGDPVAQALADAAAAGQL